MTYKEIKNSLCSYDKRNPNSQDFVLDMNKKETKQFFKETDNKRKAGKCSCDNCFYGRHELANELLKAKDEIYDLKEALIECNEMNEF